MSGDEKAVTWIVCTLIVVAGAMGGMAIVCEHVQTLRAIEAGYDQVMVEGRSSPVWQKPRG